MTTPSKEALEAAREGARLDEKGRYAKIAEYLLSDKTEPPPLNAAENELLEAMTNAFLRWPLPESVCADPCATKHSDKNRIGTNLLTAVEAKQMFRELVLPHLAPLRARADRAEEALDKTRGVLRKYCDTPMTARDALTYVTDIVCDKSLAPQPSTTPKAGEGEPPHQSP